MAQKRLVLDELNCRDLAAASGLSISGVSRILSHDPKQRRVNSEFDTLQKLQKGIRELTGMTYDLAEIAEAIRRD